MQQLLLKLNRQKTSQTLIAIDSWLRFLLCSCCIRCLTYLKLQISMWVITLENEKIYILSIWWDLINSAKVLWNIYIISISKREKMLWIVHPPFKLLKTIHLFALLRIKYLFPNKWLQGLACTSSNCSQAVGRNRLSFNLRTLSHYP